MEQHPESAAVKASNKYGERGKIVVESLGKRPMEVILENDEPMRLNDVVKSLKEDEDTPTANKRFVSLYMDIMQDYGIVEQEENAYFFDGMNLSYKKNGVSYDEFERFVDRFEQP